MRRRSSWASRRERCDACRRSHMPLNSWASRPNSSPRRTGTRARRSPEPTSRKLRARSATGRSTLTRVTRNTMPVVTRIMRAVSVAIELRGARVVLDVRLELQELQGAEDLAALVAQGHDESQGELIAEPAVRLRGVAALENGLEGRRGGERRGRKIGRLIDDGAPTVENPQPEDPLVAGDLVDQGPHVLDLAIAQSVLHRDLNRARERAPLARQLILKQRAARALVDVSEQHHDQNEGNGEGEGQSRAERHGRV